MTAGVDQQTPGITGWAQVNGRDEISIDEKVACDREYLARKSFWFDLKIILIDSCLCTLQSRGEALVLTNQEFKPIIQPAHQFPQT